MANEADIPNNKNSSASLVARVQNLERYLAAHDPAESSPPPVSPKAIKGTIIHIRGVGSFNLSEISEHAGIAALVGGLLRILLIALFRVGTRRSKSD